MSDEVKRVKWWAWRRLRPWELVSCALCALIFGLIAFPNAVRAGGSGRELVPMAIMGVSMGFAVLCFVRCPMHHWVAKTTLGFLLCGSMLVWVSQIPHRCGNSPLNACITNLKQIEGAKASWALEEHKTSNDTPGATDLYGTNRYIPEELKCPLGGTYRIGKVDEAPRCSMAEHSLE